MKHFLNRFNHQNKLFLKAEGTMAEPVDTRWPKIAYLLFILLSVGAWIYYFTNNLTLSYNDARSHLNIARRVIDSLQPGFAQIGSVWLPLQHILEIPTIWNDFMYRSGLSGSIISMIAFIGSTAMIGKMVRLIGLDKKAAFIAMVAFATNPNMLFIQTTPMTESLMIFTSLGALYFLFKWIQVNNVGYIIVSGLFILAAILTRYDGWFLFGFLAIAVPLISYLKSGGKSAEANFILFASLGFFGAALWIGWNWLIFGDPLYFINGPFSAKTQQDALLREGRLLTANNMSFSIYTYLLAIQHNMSAIIMALGGIGFFAALLSKKEFIIKIALFGFFIPVLFNIVSLYMGQSVIHLPELPPHTWFNIRYGLMALPAVAIGLAVLANKRILATIVILFVVLTQNYLMFSTNNIITIQDGVRGSSGYYLDDVGKWINTNASDGHILVASSSHDALIFISGLPLNHFITEGSQKYWNAALKDPNTYAKFIVMHEGDIVYQKIHANPKFTKNYQLVFEGKFSDVYKLKEK